MPTKNATRHDLSERVRNEMTDLLNARLSETLDYAMQIKQAHWNVKGREFVALHEMLDEMATQVNGAADMIAERAVMLGGQARGTLQAVASGSKLKPYPVEARAALEHLTALADRVAVVAAGVRQAIDAADRAGDKDTADLFTEVSRDLDKQLWYLEAHLAD